MKMQQGNIWVGFDRKEPIANDKNDFKVMI
jgi:hypothetical protein